MIDFDPRNCIAFLHLGKFGHSINNYIHVLGCVPNWWLFYTVSCSKGWTFPAKLLAVGNVVNCRGVIEKVTSGELQGGGGG